MRGSARARRLAHGEKSRRCCTHAPALACDRSRAPSRGGCMPMPPRGRGAWCALKVLACARAYSCSAHQKKGGILWGNNGAVVPSLLGRHSGGRRLEGLQERQDARRPEDYPPQLVRLLCVACVFSCVNVCAPGKRAFLSAACGHVVWCCRRFSFVWPPMANCRAPCRRL